MKKLVLAIIGGITGLLLFWWVGAVLGVLLGRYFVSKPGRVRAYFRCYLDGESRLHQLFDQALENHPSEDLSEFELARINKLKNVPKED